MSKIMYLLVVRFIKDQSELIIVNIWLITKVGLSVDALNKIFAYPSAKHCWIVGAFILKFFLGTTS